MDPIDSFEVAHHVLRSYIPKSNKTAPYTLDSMVQIMEFLGNPQDSFKTIHVAGTSGKSSTCYYAAELLRQAGYKVGLTISPHVSAINERAQINGQPLPETEYCTALNEFLQIVKTSDIHLSYFEVLVAFAYWLFAKQKVDYAVIEVGLGGLLDGTNIITRSDKLCVITDIGFDHTHILGNTLPEIAAQKAGIILPGNDVCMHEQPAEVMDAVRATCKTKQATLHLSSTKSETENLDIPQFQKRNVSLAADAVNFALERDSKPHITSESLRDASQIRIPGRMEVANYRERVVVLDGSHNDQKVEALVTGLADRFQDQPLALLVSIGRTKRGDAEAMLRQLRTVSGTIMLTTFSIGQDELRSAIPPEDLAELCEKLGFTTVLTQPNPEQAFSDLFDSTTANIVVTGSYFLLNHVRPTVMGSVD